MLLLCPNLLVHQLVLSLQLLPFDLALLQHQEDPVVQSNQLVQVGLVDPVGLVDHQDLVDHRFLVCPETMHDLPKILECY